MSLAAGNFANHLLAMSRACKGDELFANLETVDLPLGMLLNEPNRTIPHIYFPESGIGSMITSLSDGRDIEIGLFGADGMSHVGAVLGDELSPYRTVVQVAGKGNRIAADRFRRAIEGNSDLMRLFLKYARSFSIQTGSTALANGRSTIEARLARWLLMMHDRISGEYLGVTHEFLATMLGVRRPSVTDALHILEGEHLVISRRSEIVIRDRHGLAAIADGAYGLAEREAERLTGWRGKPLFRSV
ncbi:cAMP-binding domain of CRP or a regulatory subunit of cAMP-dependent protein kinases [Phyllobacterium sp. YR620]|uniref:Crp/Fnr family transcriptional regulator n=1 Tax=Phyllobacterium sp. YR620 TaxID=1881066 RepID=UPI0008827672|nr:Crp/Fnr family transcriptional regulator [Phyllobacterium sp. YR620]SDP86470.1 cAMP-binding domain of CRP or a regulatory subunit of cAMP-dependent protein kinases [Phyllobacterium sp. YR620]